MYSTPTDIPSREAFGRRGGGRRDRRPQNDRSRYGEVASYSEPPRRGRGRGPEGGDFAPGGFGPGGYGQGFGPGGRGGGHGRGRGGHGSRGRGRGPRRGDVRLAILRLLAEEPMHGYQIITVLGERSGGMWRPSPGSIYPTLQALADQGLVTSEEADGRRVFSLTDAGRAEVTEAEKTEAQAPWEAIAESADQGLVALRSRAGQVFSATRQVAAFGSQAQVERANQILADARRALYGLLAEDEPVTDEVDGEESSPEE